MTLGLYPNPASDELTVVITAAVENARYSIHGINGHEVQYGVFQGDRVTIKLKGVAPGTYLLRLLHHDEFFLKQFVVE